MKIACFVGAFPAVSETFVLDPIVGLLRRGHEVDVYADAPLAGAPVHAEVAASGVLGHTRRRPPVPRSLAKRALGALPLLLRSGPATLHPRFGQEAVSLRLLYAAAPCRGERYDAIHAYFGPLGLLAVRLRKAGAIRGPIATTFLGYDLSSFRGSYADLIDGGDLFLPICEDFRARLSSLGFDRERMQVHHLGVNAAALPFAPRAPDGAFRLISVSRLVEKKGIVFAIEAVAALRREGVPADYTVVGDGPLRGELQARIEELGASAFVRITGFLDRAAVAGKLDSAQVLLAPSVTAADGDKEGTPVAILEAMASGMPVVSTLHSGIPEMIESGVSGLLVPERDPAALTAALRDLHAHPERWEAMGRAGRARVEADFDRERLDDGLVQLLAGMGGARG